MKELMKKYDENYFLYGKTSNWEQGYNERTMRPVHELLYHHIKAFFPNAKRKLVFGCALGMQVKVSLEHKEFAVGIEWTPLLGKHKLTTNVVRGSITHLPFRDNTFDLAVSANVLEHIPIELLDQVLREQKRTCKEHFFIIPCGKPNPHDRDITHITMMSKEFWLQKLKLLGAAKYFERTEQPIWNMFVVRHET